jgi:sensor histidine kinase YesM
MPVRLREAKMIKEKVYINDTWFQLIGIPMFALVVPNISGIITHSLYSTKELIFSYGYFVLISLLIWKGNVLLYTFARHRFPWLKIPLVKIIFLFCINILYSGVLSYVLLKLWDIYSREVRIDNNNLIALLLIVIGVTFITHVYEIIYLSKERENDMLLAERSDKQKVEAELEALKSQIDPHFIFNSLNTLSFLIGKDQKKAQLFNDNLAKAYRYILSNKQKNLVLLKEEIEFISNYFYLLKIRYQKAVDMVIELEDIDTEHYLIPPIALQTLIENAIKHNDFSDHEPLGINIYVKENEVTVKNKINKKEYPLSSTGTGLANLYNRYQLITEKNLVIENNNDDFIVRLPILKF